MSTNHMPGLCHTLSYTSSDLLVNPPPHTFPWTSGAWDLALLGTGRCEVPLSLLLLSFGDMKRNL